MKTKRKNIFSLHLHSTGTSGQPTKPLFMGFSAIFQATQTPLRTAFHDTQRLLLEACGSNMCSDFVFFAPLMKK